MQETWLPQTEAEREAESDDGDEPTTLPHDAAGWLEGFNEMERRAVAEDHTTSDETKQSEGLAAAASILGYRPGDAIELSTVRTRYMQRAKTIHPDRAGTGNGDDAETRTEAFKVLAGAMTWLMEQVSRLPDLALRVARRCDCNRQNRLLQRRRRGGHDTQSHEYQWRTCDAGRGART